MILWSLVQQQPVQAPFFSSDWNGLWHIAVTFGTMTLLLGGIIVKWGQGRFQKELEMSEDANKKTADDVTNLGIKVDKIDRGCIEETARTAELRSRLDKQDIVQQNVLTMQGKFEAGIAALHAQNTELQRDITTLITDTAGRTNLAVQALAIDLARLDSAAKERERMGTVQAIRDRDGKDGVK